MTHATATLDPEILRSHGFSFDYALCEGEEPEEIYQGWEIFIYRPNGGALAVEIAEVGSAVGIDRWAYPTAPEFDYLDDDDKILALARAAIDAASI